MSHRLYGVLFMLLLVVPQITAIAEPSAPIYVSVILRSEEPGLPYPDFINDEAAFQAHRAAILAFAEMLNRHEIRLNYQPGWNFLQAMMIYDQASPETGDKNLLRYLSEDLQASIDPGAHDTTHNYADIAYLIEMLGVTPSQVASDFFAAPPEYSRLETLWHPMTGEQYPDYTWQAAILQGARSAVDPGQVWAAGVWQPQDSARFIVHDLAAPLPYVGAYGETWADLDQLIALQQNGDLKPDQIYTTSLVVSQLDLVEDSSLIADFEAEIESVAAAAAVEWADVVTIVQRWQTDFQASPNLLPRNEAMLAQTPADPDIATLVVDIDYTDDWYRETFNYLPEAANIRHYVLVIPASEAQATAPGLIFGNIRFPEPEEETITLTEGNAEYEWALPYLYEAPGGHFYGVLPAGDYQLAAAFIAAPLTPAEAGAPEGSLYAGVTGGGASTDYQTITLTAGATEAMLISMTDANGWACPWLYVDNGHGWERRTEILRNLSGREQAATESTSIGTVQVVDSTVRLQIREEKEEITYLDEFYILVDGVRIDPGVASLAAQDGDYLVLHHGESYTLTFTLPASETRAVAVQVVASGYYVPES